LVSACNVGSTLSVVEEYNS